MRPAAYAISLWPFSSSTSNMALGSACETTASITTACSFSCSGAVTRLRACLRGPLRGVDDLAKSPKSLPARRFSVGAGHGAPALAGGTPITQLSPVRCLERARSTRLSPIWCYRDCRACRAGYSPPLPNFLHEAVVVGLLQVHARPVGLGIGGFERLEHVVGPVGRHQAIGAVHAEVGFEHFDESLLVASGEEAGGQLPGDVVRRVALYVLERLDARPDHGLDGARVLLHEVGRHVEAAGRPAAAEHLFGAGLRA